MPYLGILNGEGLVGRSMACCDFVMVVLIVTGDMVNIHCYTYSRLCNMNARVESHDNRFN